ncbi:MAG: hypothetical protein RIT32_133 [Actinomycetota bacterium]|jgi:hypothetical protein
MRPSGFIYMAGALFYIVVAAIYWVWTAEIVGTTAMLLTGFLALLTGFYVLFTSRRLGVGPEDIETAEIADADPDYGFYSPGSWWPLPVAFSAAVIAVGLIFAVWLVLLGMVALFISLGGWMLEYYRGPRLPEA